jgi:hypothetical protein
MGNHAVLKALVAGWTLQGITNWRSGLPVNVTAGTLLVRNGRVDGQRPDYVPGTDPYSRDTTALTWLNRAAFDNTIPAAEGRFGSLGYNALRGPSGFSFDGALHKEIPIREGHRMTFRLEAFNATNHKILGNPNATVTNPNFGQIQTASGGRNVQLALKYLF